MCRRALGSTILVAALGVAGLVPATAGSATVRTTFAGAVEVGTAAAEANRMTIEVVTPAPARAP